MFLLFLLFLLLIFPAYGNNNYLRYRIIAFYERKLNQSSILNPQPSIINHQPS